MIERLMGFSARRDVSMTIKIVSRVGHSAAPEKSCRGQENLECRKH